MHTRQYAPARKTPWRHVPPVVMARFAAGPCHESHVHAAAAVCPMATSCLLANTPPIVPCLRVPLPRLTPTLPLRPIISGTSPGTDSCSVLTMCRSAGLPISVPPPCVATWLLPRHVPEHRVRWLLPPRLPRGRGARPCFCAARRRCSLIGADASRGVHVQGLQFSGCASWCQRALAVVVLAVC